MENVVLTIHLLLALALVGVVLLQGEAISKPESESGTIPWLTRSSTSTLT